jgi:multisubunit Na+/H+ antiporter MnhG subunit
MATAKFMETTSLILLLLVVLLAPVIIYLVKSATSTIQVQLYSNHLENKLRV